MIYADPPVAVRGLLATIPAKVGRLKPLSDHVPGEIKAFDVASIAADDCVLFLWATRADLPEALRRHEGMGI